MAMLSVEECLRRIGRLPQAAFIDSETALRWIRLTMRIDPERIDWHIARAGGIGGSESGTLVAWAYGEFHTRSTADRLAKGKLLLMPPDRANDDMARGAYLESHIQEIFEAKLTRDGRRWRRRDDIKAHIEAGPHPDYPFLRASLDGVYEIDGALVIVDFKAPSEDSLDSYVRNRDFDDYRTQLNHYCLVADGRDVQIDGLLLAMYDYRRVASVGVQVFDIARDPTLQQQIINASQAFWHEFVMQGAIPDEKRERRLEANGGIPAEIEEAARRAVVSKMIADKATKDYEEAQQAIAHWVKRTGDLGDGVLVLGSMAEGAEGFLRVRAKPVLDVERALNRLRELGMREEDIENLRGPDKYDAKKLVPAYDDMVKLMARVAEAARSGKDISGLLSDVDKALKMAPVREAGDFDEQKIAEALDYLGENSYSFGTEKISSGLPRGKRQDLEERRALVGDQLEILVGGLVSCKREPDLEDVLPEGPALR